MSPKKPNLFIVGSTRCGTTSMGHYLNQNPDIFFVREGEPHFFAQDIPGDRFKDEKSYLDLFLKAKNEKWIGESSTFYLFSDYALKNIKKFSKGVKIMIMLRNPADMIISKHNEVSKSPWYKEETISSLAEALSAEEGRKKASKHKIEKHFYRTLAHYSTYVKKYLKKYGKENVKIIILEELSKNPEKVYNEVMDFLELPHFTPTFEIMNRGAVKGNSFYSKSTILLKTRFGFIYNIIRNSVPLEKRKIIRERTRASRNKETNKEIRAELVKEFIPETEEIEKIIGRRLEDWRR